MTRKPVNRRNIPTDLWPLIKTIKDEGRAYRKEEQSEDHAKKIREWITVGIVFATLVAVLWQVHEMIKVYEPIKEQAEALKTAADAAKKQSESAERSIIESERAWVGPYNVSLAAKPNINTDNALQLLYRNYGRQPALNFDFDFDLFVLGDDVEKDDHRFDDFVNDCRSKTEAVHGGTVVFPGVGGGDPVATSNNLEIELPSMLFDKPVMNGDKPIVLQGCFTYLSFEKAHHSYFCYFYNGKYDDWRNLNICRGDRARYFAD